MLLCAVWNDDLLPAPDWLFAFKICKGVVCASGGLGWSTGAGVVERGWVVGGSVVEGCDVAVDGRDVCSSGWSGRGSARGCGAIRCCCRAAVIVGFGAGRV